MINLTLSKLKTISEGLEIAIGTFENEDYMEISEKWSKVLKKINNYLGSVEGVKAQTKQIKSTATKLPKKKLKLENVLEEENLSNMSTKNIYHLYLAGKDWKSFDFNKGFEELIKKAKDSIYIYLAGKDWKTFDFNKGFNELIKKDKTGFYIYRAGKDWKSFDFKKGFEELVKRDKDGKFIYYAGKYWKTFDYKRGFEELKNTEYYKQAIENWPKGIEDAKKEIENLRKTSIKLPKKKLKLEGNMEFKNYLEEEELKQIEKELNEDIVSFIGSALGYGTAGLIGAFGGTLLILGGLKATKGLIGLWKKIFKNTKGIFKPSAVIKEVKTDARVNKVKQEMIQTKNKYEDELKYVLMAITNKDFTQAKEELAKTPPTLQNNPDVHKTIITEITKSLRMPPIYLASPGNFCYQKIKQILGIKVARASAAATELALKNTTLE